MVGTSPRRVALGCLWPMVLALLVACGGGSGSGGDGVSGSSVFVATLTGAKETPSNASVATGSGVATVEMATKVLAATVTTAGMIGTAAHIHNGAPGISGPIVFPLAETSVGSGRWTATVTLTVEQLNLLLSGNTYFNVHSVAFPDGEIRGQIIFQQATGGGGGGGY